MTEKHVTMREVAERAGVSKMTVSAVLSGAATNVRVSETTRERVLLAVKEMKYQPNSLARSLRRGHTNIIGLYCGFGYLNARNTFLAEIIGGVQEGCDSYHKDLLIHGVFRGQSVEDIYGELVDGRIDGLVLQAMPDDPLVAKLKASKFPVVTIVDVIPGLPSVSSDNRLGAQLQVDYLKSIGVHKVYYHACEYVRESIERRKWSFRVAAMEAGIEIQEWTYDSHSEQQDPMIEEIAAEARKRSDIAVVCYNDGNAYRRWNELRRLGIQIPEQIKLIGYDGLELEGGMSCQLTTVDAGWSRVARRAVELLAARIEGQTVPELTCLPVRLMIGGTA